LRRRRRSTPPPARGPDRRAGLAGRVSRERYPAGRVNRRVRPTKIGVRRPRTAGRPRGNDQIRLSGRPASPMLRLRPPTSPMVQQPTQRSRTPPGPTPALRLRSPVIPLAALTTHSRTPAIATAARPTPTSPTPGSPILGSLRPVSTHQPNQPRPSGGPATPTPQSPRPGRNRWSGWNRQDQGRQPPIGRVIPRRRTSAVRRSRISNRPEAFRTSSLSRNLQNGHRTLGNPARRTQRGHPAVGGIGG
jgi:hypothetical protein